METRRFLRGKGNGPGLAKHAAAIVDAVKAQASEVSDLRKRLDGVKKLLD